MASMERLTASKLKWKVKSYFVGHSGNYIPQMWGRILTSEAISRNSTLCCEDYPSLEAISWKEVWPFVLLQAKFLPLQKASSAHLSSLEDSYFCPSEDGRGASLIVLLTV